MKISKSLKITLYLITLLQLCYSGINAQNVGINNPNPHAKSLLDLTSTDKGLLTPRMTEAQRNAMFPAADGTAAGMIVYQTDNNSGYYYYNGSAWWMMSNEKSGWGVKGNSGTNPTTDYIGTSDYLPLVIKSNNTERMRITETGLIGVNINTPEAALHIKSNSITGFQNIKLTEAGNDWARLGFANDSSSNFWEIASHPENVDSISTMSLYHSTYGNVLTTFGNGKVGLSQSIPAAQLSLNNSLGNKLSIYGTYANMYGFGIQTSLMQIFSGHVNADIAFGYGNSLAFTENMRIKGNGNVGIGISTPTGKLHIAGNSVTGTQLIKLKETGNDYARVGLYNDSTSKFWEIAGSPNVTDSVSRLNIYHSSTGDLFSIFGNGRVGIQQSNPAALLSLSNTLGNKLSLFGSYNSMYGFGIQNNLLQMFSSQFASDIAFGYGNSLAFTENMRIRGNGNVGIGTTVPVQRLHVNGNINIPADSSYRINNFPVLFTKGFQSLSVGINAGLVNTGTANTFTGFQSGLANTSGGLNTFYGHFSGLSNQTGVNNTFIGKDAGKDNITGQGNTYVGLSAGTANDGNNNVFIGLQSGSSATSGSYNTFIGNASGGSSISGSNNVAIGNFANVAANTTNATAIGANSYAAISNSLVLGVSGTNVGIGVSSPTSTLEVNGFSKLGSNAPAIKTLKLNGITPSVAGGYNEILLSVSPAKIISISVMVEYAPNQFIPAGFKGFPGFEFYYYINALNRLGIQLMSGNSAAAVNLPYKVFIVYES